jgi:hypothetical protein
MNKEFTAILQQSQATGGWTYCLQERIDGRA